MPRPASDAAIDSTVWPREISFFQSMLGGVTKHDVWKIITIALLAVSAVGASRASRRDCPNGGFHELRVASSPPMMGLGTTAAYSPPA